MEKNPNKRLKLRDALSHKFFNDVSSKIVEIGGSSITKCLIERLESFHLSSQFQQECIKAMVDMNQDYHQIEDQLRYVFFYLDYTCNGVVDCCELKKFYKQIGIEKSEEGIDKIIHSITMNRTNYLTYTDFLAATIDRSFFYDENRL